MCPCLQNDKNTNNTINVNNDSERYLFQKNHKEVKESNQKGFTINSLMINNCETIYANNMNKTKLQ